MLFILVQQVIFVDLAYNWNDSWVEKADTAEAEERGTGKKWLAAILISVAILFIASITGWVLLYYFFGGCSTNTAFITVTVAFSILITAAQLSGEEGSLLSSGIITMYSTSLCYSAVGKNPDPTCNPFLGENDLLGVVIGISLTLVSLGYAGWSSTADRTLSGNSETDGGATEQNTAPEATKVGGVVTNDYGAADGGDDGATPHDEEIETMPNNFSNSWKLNLVLGAVSCWFSMALTTWGSIQGGGDAANPQVGEVSMWMIIASQWFVLTLYLWTLVAPRLFPGRDFS